MYQNNLFIKDGIIYDTTDGCIKKNIFENEMWTLSVMIFTYRVIIDRCINDPCHDIIKIDGINLYDKK